MEAYMAAKIHKPEEIINKLREAEILLSQGQNIKSICRALGVSDYTYFQGLNIEVINYR